MLLCIKNSRFVYTLSFSNYMNTTFPVTVNWIQGISHVNSEMNGNTRP